MCLTVKSSKPKTAMFAKTVYKVVKVLNNERVVSCYRDYEYKKNIRPKFVELIPEPTTVGYDIDEGYHSFCSKRSARRICKSLNGCIFPSAPYIYKTMKCIIPARTPYFKGTFQKEQSFASSKLILRFKYLKS